MAIIRPLLIIAAGYGIYWLGLTIKPFGDNFQMIFPDPQCNPLTYFLHEVKYCLSYRPIHATLSSWSQIFFGQFNTLPINFLQITAHILLALLVWHASVRLGLSTPAAITASLYMLASQANTMAVLDNFSQVLGTLFGCISLWLLFLYLGNNKQRLSFYITGIIAFLISVWSKETSISLLLQALLIVLLFSIKEKSFRLKDVLLVSLPFLAITLSYIILRSSLPVRQPSFGHGMYQFHIGLNIIKNSGLMIFGASIPVSSVDFALAYKNGETAYVLAVSLLAFAFVAGIFLLPLKNGDPIPPWAGWSSAKSDKTHRPLILILTALAITGILPVIILNHVSEAYVYTMMPYISIIFGFALNELFRHCTMKRIWRTVLIFIIGVMLISHFLAVRSKMGLLINNGEQAHILLAQIKPYILTAPSRSSIWLVDPAKMGGKEYSIFVLRGFNVLENGLDSIKRLLGREDLSLRIIGENNLEKARRPANLLRLRLVDGKMERF